MGLGPSSIESRATHTVPNHDARAFPGGYGFFERNPVPRTQHARERSWVNVGLFSNTVKRRFFAAVHVPSSFIFLLRPVWKEGGPMVGEPEGTAGGDGVCV